MFRATTGLTPDDHAAAHRAEPDQPPEGHAAVVEACGSDNLAVAIPCHRVVKKDGPISGYRCGAGRKRALLARERSHKEFSPE